MNKLKKNHQVLLLKISCAILILLWVYTALNKLIDLQEFRLQLNNQNFSKTTAALLLYLIPISELLAVLLLLFKKTISIGLTLSTILLTIFTAYIFLVLIGFYDKIPCSCGGVLKEMGWTAHLFFNLFFLSLNLIALKFQLQQQHNKN